jgi:hypothetical protein
VGLSAKVGNLTIAAATAVNGTHSVTGLSFQPKWVLLWWSGLTATNTGTRTTHYRGIGMAASASNMFAVFGYDEDAAPSANANRSFREDCCVGINAGGTVVGYADLQSFNTDGFTLEVLDQFPADVYVSYLAVGGTDITNVECGRFTATGTAPVNQSVTNTGSFQPTITFFVSHGGVTDPPNAVADSGLMFGVATSSSDEHVHWSGQNNAGGTGATASYNLAGECGASNTNSPVPSPVNRFEFVSHDAGGFTINHLERTDAARVAWCSIKGGRWSVGDVTTKTDTSTAITQSGLAFQPVAGLWVSAGNAATTADAAGAAHDTWSVGAATSASERECQYVDSRDANTTMFIHCAARQDCVYINADPANTAFTLEGLMDLTSFNIDGYSAIMDDADPSAAFVWHVLVGADAAATVSRRPSSLMVTGIGRA